MGSGLIMIGFLFMVTESASRLGSIYDIYLIDLLVVSRFIIKLGIFPLHFWFPSVMGMSSWFRCFWLSVVQKVGPFWALSGLGLIGFSIFFLLSFFILTSVIGAFGGIAQVQFRPLLAYSSLGQTG